MTRSSVLLNSIYMHGMIIMYSPAFTMVLESVFEFCFVLFYNHNLLSFLLCLHELWPLEKTFMFCRFLARKWLWQRPQGWIASVIKFVSPILPWVRSLTDWIYIYILVFRRRALSGVANPLSLHHNLLLLNVLHIEKERQPRLILPLHVQPFNQAAIQRQTCFEAFTSCTCEQEG